MPTTYKLTKPPLDPNRLQKIAKDLIKEAGDDRKLALDAHKYFREMVDETPTDSAAKGLMVETLKLAQASKNNVIKILNLLVKMEETPSSSNLTKASKGSENSLFNALDTITND